jgi:hypothetical protein
MGIIGMIVSSKQTKPVVAAGTIIHHPPEARRYYEEL